MTRTDVVASSRPQVAGAASIRMGASGASRRFLGLTVALLLAAALAAPTTALAASTGETGYSQTPTSPTTTTTKTEPKSGTSPAEPKSGTSPAKEVSPSKAATTSTTPTTTKTEAAKAQTLPFTGLDLRWIVALGILMMGAGFSIVTVQRRQRRGR